MSTNHRTARRTNRARAARWRPRAAVLGLAAALVLAGGCSSQRPESSGLLAPYRLTLPQGNYLTQEMLDQVKPGMSRQQVRAILGIPLLNPMFRDDRWDYVFRLQHPSGQAELRRVVVRFADDRVATLEHDPLPQREDPSDPALPGYRPRPPASQASTQAPAGTPAEAGTAQAPVASPGAAAPQAKP